MKTHIKPIPIALAKAGMKMGKSMCNSQGQILLMAGIVLSDQALDSLRRRGVATIPILVEEVRSEDELCAERANVLDRLNWLFRNRVDNNCLLYHLILEYRMERLI